jgi:hypothetical protein
MDFHEGYWVVVGTAAPVIALALSVTAATSSAAIYSKVRGSRRVRSNIEARIELPHWAQWLA